jgi:hypothetical protein
MMEEMEKDDVKVLVPRKPAIKLKQKKLKTFSFKPIPFNKKSSKNFPKKISQSQGAVDKKSPLK